MAKALPKNVHISKHPCLRAKLSQLRDQSISGRETRALIHEISLILGCEATAACLTVAEDSEDMKTHLDQAYIKQTISPKTISIVPILRSGLGMLEAIQTILPHAVSVHHLGLCRETTTLQPVEYYSNLSFNVPPTSNQRGAQSTEQNNIKTTSLAILLDPMIAMGRTCTAAIRMLKVWGAQKIIVISLLGAREGIERVAKEWEEGVEIWLAGMDEYVNEYGVIIPGLGDVGDRLFLTAGS
ncbi:Uracil phosphoribosyltransferase [Golovinomyces cichoracearum]|uniref:uracil phosphoribosyltransferase n=1 Tax=Golovinomyces cichoracearum TaxID=62708 RepID=A0A420IGD2_9PEZI|nr:Uracil phosphoribosyltransferase [Golovinomyces cichoracearum]RKF73605.1 Uracil phosphoribosyltransferase [Golovinomyces cichoracearum]RKF75614.1 Uracil phosphoribosyltransferase [Golovinomyces cichoracearum]